MNLNKLTISEALKGLKEKEFSAEELTGDCFKAIESQDKKINAFITLLKEEAQEKAKNIANDFSSFQNKSLAGIPLAIKDNILIQGVLCTAGSKMLSSYKATYNATVINKLEDAAAIFIGKTNMDEFAMGGSTETSYFGPTRNPHNLDYVPGGSSGGSAAAVSADMCLGALGSDTGGSIRQPASFCGIVGLKPTYGRVSRYGLMAMASSLDQIGCFTKSVDDAALLLKVIEGKDKNDSTSIESNSELIQPTSKDAKKMKVGLIKECFVDGLEKSVKKQIEKTIKNLESFGIEFKEISIPHLKAALACYYIIMPAEVSANLARYDGIRYGYNNPKAENLLDLYLKNRTGGFGDEVRRRIILGAYILSAGYYDAYYRQAQKVQSLLKQDFQEAFKEVDCLVSATSPTTAFKIGEKINDPLQMYLADIFTVPVNLAGLPAISVPCGQVDNLPVGFQIIGNLFEENKILSLAKAVEETNEL